MVYKSRSSCDHAFGGVSVWAKDHVGAGPIWTQSPSGLRGPHGIQDSRANMPQDPERAQGPNGSRACRGAGPI